MVERLKAKRKKMLWARWTLFGMAIASCLVPTIIAIKTAIPSISSNFSWIGISTFGLCMAAIVAIIVARGAVREISCKLPFTVGVLVSELIVLGILFGLKAMIEDAVLIFEVSAIGAAVGSVFNVASYFLANEAKDIKEKILRLEVKDE